MADANESSTSRRSWALFLLVTALSASGLGAIMNSEKSEARAIFLPGPTSSGHYQIELDCAGCHTASFSSTEDLDGACVHCHGAELTASKDSHPKSKFTDPRNASRIAELDARSCLTCHVEHAPGRTTEMGLSLPRDYCFRCHQEIGQERPSHQGLAFDSCASSGCHNYHDNRGIYEDFLVKHAGEPEVLSAPLAQRIDAKPCPSEERARLGSGGGDASCADCHAPQAQTFASGKHGMRAARGLKRMSPALARLPMKASAAGHELACASCHQRPEDPLFASVTACEGCHNDEHTWAYRDSKHFERAERAARGEMAAKGAVTCATCHMPSGEDESGVMFTSHNQNDNLRPPEKMLRSVCLSCHGLAFSLDAIADSELVRKNFDGRPGAHVLSVDWAMKRIQ
jgi:hypothetical protein